VTIEELHAEIDATAGYEAAGDVALAGRFQTAVRALRAKLPYQSSKDGVFASFDLKSLGEMDQRVTRWIGRKRANSQVRRFGMQEFRRL
jgi:hypothetical protein